MSADEFDWNDPEFVLRFKWDLRRYAQALGITSFQAKLRVIRQEDILREFSARQLKDEETPHA